MNTNSMSHLRALELSFILEGLSVRETCTGTIFQKIFQKVWDITRKLF